MQNIQLRICDECGEEKLLTKDNFSWHKVSFMKTCKICRRQEYDAKTKNNPVHRPPEVRKKISETIMKKTPEERRKGSVEGGKAPKPSRRGKKLSNAHRKKLSESHMGLPCNLNEEQRKVNGQRFAQMNRERNLERNGRPHRREQSGNNLRNAWKETPEKMFAGKYKRGTTKRGTMTSIEKKVFIVLEPLGFSYEPICVTIAKKRYFPDFVCEKNIVEVLGSYWHTQEETDLRIAALESQGYRVLVLWDTEIEYNDIIPVTLATKIYDWMKKTA